MYTEMKNKNEMIKDGYHVNSVFIHEYQTPSYVRKLDVLRRFREEIVNETFTNTKSISIWEFLEMCTEEDSNFSSINRNNYHELEVNYTMDKKKYTMVYSTQKNNRIRFPIYSEDTVRNKDVSNGIISATLVFNEDDEEGKDITEQIAYFAGPLENFYQGTEYVVNRKWLSYVGIEADAIIKIMDMNANTLTFLKKDEVLSLE